MGCKVHCYCQTRKEHLITIGTCCRCGQTTESSAESWKIINPVYPGTAAPLDWPNRPQTFCFHDTIGGRPHC